MSYHRIFTGVIKNGIFIPSSLDAQKYKEFISRNEGKYCKISIVREHGIRSVQQNKYLWGVVYKTIAEEIGEDDVDNIHEQMSLMFNGKKIKVWDETTGEIKETKIPGNTSSLTTVEFEQYIEKIRRWASKFLGIYIPLPNEVVIEKEEQ